MVTKSAATSRTKFLAFILIIGSIIFNVVACGDSGANTPDLSTDWAQIVPSQVYPDFTYEGLAPSCSASIAGVPYDKRSATAIEFSPDFSFFVKGGKSNNLVIFFEGGGGCWSGYTCLVSHYFQEDVVKVDLDTGAAPKWFGNGIFDTANVENPFKDWFFVYIPYCTGDFHIGAKDTEYTYSTLTGTVRHRGAVNFQVVLQWIKDQWTKKGIDLPDKVLITGSGTGNYGAIYNFPSLADVFPDSSLYQLGDAGNGVIPIGAAANPTYSDLGDYGIDKRPTFQSSWNPILPTKYTNAFLESTIVDYYNAAAAAYPNARFGQFTRGLDKDQITLYMVMNTYIFTLVATAQISATDGFKMAAGTWVPRMNVYARALAETNPTNYRYVIATGTVPMINTNNNFYSQVLVDGNYLDWLKGMLDPLSDAWVNIKVE